MDKIILGKRIKAARLTKGYTQERLSEESQISVVYLSEIERGLKLPSLTLFVKLADILKVSADYLLRDDLNSGRFYVYDDITSSLEALTQKQRIACAELIEVFIKHIS